MKVAINKCYGGFSLSEEAEKLYLSKKRKPIVTESEELSDEDSWGHDYFDPGCQKTRCDPVLIEVIEALGKRANGFVASIRIIEIPFSDTKGWHISEHDGSERICEDRMSWG